MKKNGNKVQRDSHLRVRHSMSLQLEICGHTVVVTGNWIKTAEIRDEQVVEGTSVEDPELFITRLKESELKADVFTFTQRPPEITPKYDYHFEWDNWAVISTTSFKDWWEMAAARVKEECQARRQARRNGESCPV